MFATWWIIWMAALGGMLEIWWPGSIVKRLGRWTKLLGRWLSLVVLAVIAVRWGRDPLATSLRKFQRQANRHLCYQTIAELERKTLGETYTNVITGDTRPDGTPYDGGYIISCRRQECRKHRYHAGY